MRVLQAIAGSDHGGAEKFFLNLVLSLKRAGLSQKVLLHPSPTLAPKLTEHGLDVKQIFGSPGDMHMRFRFLKAIGEFEPDVVMTWMAGASYLCPKHDASSGLKKFVHVARLGGYYNLNYYKSCDYLIGNTPHLVQYFHDNGWSEQQTAYIPNFTIPPDSNSHAISRQRYETPDGVPLVLALGRFVEEKGFDVLLNAVKRTPEMHLWLAGDNGELKGEIEQLVTTLGISERVRILPWHDDVTPLFKAADLFVCPSRSEPLGNVILEAWAHEVAVVATASYGPSQLIEDGHNGILVPIDDADALAQAMERVISDQKMSRFLAAAGLESVNSRFSEAVVVKAYLEFFENIVRKASVCV